MLREVRLRVREKAEFRFEAYVERSYLCRMIPTWRTDGSSEAHLSRLSSVNLGHSPALLRGWLRGTCRPGKTLSRRRLNRMAKNFQPGLQATRRSLGFVR